MDIEVGQVYRLKEGVNVTLWKPLLIKITWAGIGKFQHNLNEVMWSDGLIIHNYVLEDEERTG